MNNYDTTLLPDPTDLTYKHQERVEEYRATALDDPDPVSANVAAVTSNLMDLERRLDTALGGAMAGEFDVVNDFPQIAPALNAYLRTTRQIQSFVQLTRQLAHEREDAPRREK